ncbi:O-antigen/teichoic acid export membrane protein [Lewinella aquimaris]|uniref:O-antigen/teichoic acid export membrane protein n=1 Tax=Neolewinella aquimaris TaxID=1835722 RepID=A0A840E738_9BACT|nr:polysaccharide biosynthesis protein [Neolewinella aquimaris]MBB4079027.1 O-antigen/teichoic acid export membrane protein [Neolewinella aquimaris]
MQIFSDLAARSPKLFKWGKLLGVTGGAQLVIQGVGFIVGIFIIRTLSTEQYAYYTLANTMLGTMTVLADGGISTGVMSEGGKKWQDKQELGKILATGMHMRQQFAVGSLIVSVPILYYLLQEQGVVWWESILLILCLAPTFWAALSGSLLQIVPKLHQDINELLKINVTINVVRLLVTLPVLLLFPFASLAVLASGVSQVGGNLQFRKLSLKKADWQTAFSPEYRTKIMASVKRILPGSIYYCISGQITVWLIAIFSSTESIAQIGALSRLMMLLTLVRLSIEMLIVPRYARLPADRRLIIVRFFQVVGLISLLCAAIVGAVYLFPNIFLWILGSKYQDLEHEVVLMTMGSCLMLISGVMHMMSSSRGIIPQPYLFIGATIVFQVLVLLYLVDYTTLAGVLWFSILSALSNILYRIVDFFYQTLKKMEFPDHEVV